MHKNKIVRYIVQSKAVQQFVGPGSFGWTPDRSKAQLFKTKGAVTTDCGRRWPGQRNYPHEVMYGWRRRGHPERQAHYKQACIERAQWISENYNIIKLEF